MALPGCANTEPHGGRSVLTTVPPAVEKGHFTLVTGHDLHGLKLPEQTVGRGVDVDTRGEMLPSAAARVALPGSIPAAAYERVSCRADGSIQTNSPWAGSF